MVIFQTSETQTDPVLDEVFDWDLSGNFSSHQWFLVCLFVSSSFTEEEQVKFRPESMSQPKLINRRGWEFLEKVNKGKVHQWHQHLAKIFILASAWQWWHHTWELLVSDQCYNQVNTPNFNFLPKSATVPNLFLPTLVPTEEEKEREWEREWERETEREREREKM